MSIFAAIAAVTGTIVVTVLAWEIIGFLRQVEIIDRRYESLEEESNIEP